MALVLVATGLFLYLRLEAELNSSVNQSLRSRADNVGSLVGEADTGLGEARRGQLVESEESFAQVLDRDGRIVDATPRLKRAPLLDRRQIARVSTGTFMIEKRGVFDPGEPSRLLATPVVVRDRRLVVVTGASLEDNRDALSNLARLLTIGGPIALLLASLAGYGAASAALRPVETMRRKAADITEHAPGERLPVPQTRDEIARLGTTLNEMLERLEHAFARERGFVADASHELRTPLAILRTELELALRNGRSPEELHAALRSAADETDRLSQLAEDLLVIARADQGQLPIKTVSIDAADLLGDLEQRFALRLQEAGRTLTVEVPDEMRLTADPLRLEQAIGNLVDNALRHGAGEIRISIRLVNGQVELHVIDRGPGFPPDFLDTAFERFSRADHARSGGGSGLGLAIVAAIAEAHGGEAHARNSEHGGADVWMEIPGAPVGEAARPLI